MALTEYPGPHPEPPHDLPVRVLPMITRHGPWMRIHTCAFEPLYFGKQIRNRFDDPDGSFGVLYVADDAHGAFAETFGQSLRQRLIALSDLDARCLAVVDATRPLTLVDLTGSGLLQLGADARLLSGSHAISRQWARALWDHPSQPDGLYYRARHDPSRYALAIYDRAASVIHSTLSHKLTDTTQRALLADILDTYGVGI